MIECGDHIVRGDFRLFEPAVYRSFWRSLFDWPVGNLTKSSCDTVMFLPLVNNNPNMDFGVEKSVFN